jgi:outer membrane PBP1 activator LpoA protein
MKNIIGILIFASLLSSCATSVPSTSSVITNVSDTPEAKAKAITDKMKTRMVLSSEQESKVMLINVINIKVLSKLRETQDHDKIISTQSKYEVEIKEVLDENQFSIFKNEFGELK